MFRCVLGDPNGALWDILQLCTQLMGTMTVNL